MTMNVALNNGVQMPALGLGVFQTPPDVTAQAVADFVRASWDLPGLPASAWDDALVELERHGLTR